MNDLNELFSLLAEEKKKKKEFEDRIKEAARKDFNETFMQLSPQSKPKEIVEEVLIEAKPISTPIGEVPVPQQIAPTNNFPGTDQWLKTPQVSVPNTSEADISVINKKIKFLEQWIGKIQNAGPGGGEVNLRYLDDVARETIADGRWLKYDASRKKFIFDDINPYEVVENTTEVTTPTYTVNSTDFYIGVNYAGPVTITLPASANSGRMLLIKDEDGDAETNPITVVGTVDNDAGGFIIQINNGAIQLIYRNGWRIV
jgi:hypothetical protein